MRSAVQEQEKEIYAAIPFEQDGFSTTVDAEGNPILFAEEHMELCKTFDEASQCTRTYDPMNPPVSAHTCDYEVDSLFQLDDADNKMFQMAFCVSGVDSNPYMYTTTIRDDVVHTNGFPGAGSMYSGSTNVRYAQDPSNGVDEWIRFNPNAEQKCMGKGYLFINQNNWGVSCLGICGVCTNS